MDLFVKCLKFIKKFYFRIKQRVDLIWLENNQNPWEEVIQKWEVTFSIREKIFKSEKSLKQILLKRPILKYSIGFLLISNTIINTIYIRIYKFTNTDLITYSLKIYLD